MRLTSFCSLCHVSFQHEINIFVTDYFYAVAFDTNKEPYTIKRRFSLNNLRLIRLERSALSLFRGSFRP